MPNHWAQSWAVKHQHKLVNCSINAKHRARSWAVKHRHKLLNCSINTKLLGTILSCQKPTQASKLFYQCQTTGHDLRDYKYQTLGMILSCQTPTQACKLFYQCQTTGHELRDYQCQTLGMISTNLLMPNHWARSRTVIKAESISINVYLDIYVTDSSLIYVFTRLARIYISVVKPVTDIIIS